MVIGLTGGIGSGKSVVAKLFEIMGCAVFNSDQSAKEIYFDTNVKPQIVALLGEEAYLSESVIDKKYISTKIFSDTALLQKLNAILHPAVIKRFEDFKIVNAGKLVIKETALLFEAKLEAQVDKIVVVAANDELRIQRAIQRDGLNREDVLSKIKAQLPQEEKIKKADFVIYNNEVEFLITQVLTIYGKLKHA